MVVAHVACCFIHGAQVLRWCLSAIYRTVLSPLFMGRCAGLVVSLWVALIGCGAVMGELSTEYIRRQDDEVLRRMKTDPMKRKIDHMRDMGLNLDTFSRRWLASISAGFAQLYGDCFDTHGIQSEEDCKDMTVFALQKFASKDGCRIPQKHVKLIMNDQAVRLLHIPAPHPEEEL